MRQRRIQDIARMHWMGSGTVAEAGALRSCPRFQRSPAQLPHPAVSDTYPMRMQPLDFMAHLRRLYDSRKPF
jgi:hypothetical protein